MPEFQTKLAQADRARRTAILKAAMDAEIKRLQPIIAREKAEKAASETLAARCQRGDVRAQKLARLSVERGDADALQRPYADVVKSFTEGLQGADASAPSPNLPYPDITSGRPRPGQVNYPGNDPHRPDRADFNEANPYRRGVSLLPGSGTRSAADFGDWARDGSRPSQGPGAPVFEQEGFDPEAGVRHPQTQGIAFTEHEPHRRGDTPASSGIGSVSGAAGRSDFGINDPAWTLPAGTVMPGRGVAPGAAELRRRLDGHDGQPRRTNPDVRSR